MSVVIRLLVYPSVNTFLWRTISWLIRPPDTPDIHVGGLIFYRDSFLLLFYCLISELAEQNSTISGHIVGSMCNLKRHVRNLGHPFPCKSGAPKPPFWRFRNLRATLTAYILKMKHDVQKLASAFQTTRCLLRRLKTTWTLVHKRLEIRPNFLATLRKFGITFSPCWLC